VRNNALKLAYRILRDGFIPDVIYVSLRGGAYLGNVISEYLKIVRKGSRPIHYAAVVAHSYTDVARSGKVRIDGWTYSPEHLRSGDKILLVDDIFDTGNTINYLAKVILDRGISRDNLKIAVHDYKYYFDKPEQLPIQPDYWCRKRVKSVNDEDDWIHYMSYELGGLSQEEIDEYYNKQDPDLPEAMQLVAVKKQG
jgi:hypoxanthine phosphoribosyltransferase